MSLCCVSNTWQMSGSEAIQRFPKDGTFSDFMNSFLLRNEPCIFDEKVTREWPARQLWVDKGGAPDLNYLSMHFGRSRVPVADCSRERFSSHEVSEMSLDEYVTYWKSLLEEGRQHHRRLYLKDWHFVREFGMECAYTLLEFFTSDWLNEVWSSRQDVRDDYRFVYIGPAGTWTPFHADVFRSYSWSANVCGTKEWLLLPPGGEDSFRDSLGNLPLDITSQELQDRRRYPNAHRGSRPLRVVQKAGEVIFVPSGWYHQVRNLEDTISINHNWSNAFGVRHMWTHLQEELKLVQRELSDVREMEGWDKQCQVVLRSSAGMDHSEFVQLLCAVAIPRLTQLQSLLSRETTVSWIEELKSLVDEITSSPLSFHPSGGMPPALFGGEPGDNMGAILGSTPCRLEGVLVYAGIERLTSELFSKEHSNLLLFRTYELQVILSLLKEIQSP